MIQSKRVQYKPVSDVIEDAAGFIDPLPENAKVRLARLLPTVIRDFTHHITPTYRTIQMALQSNGTIPMPPDTVRPVKVFLKKKCQGTEVLFQFGYWDKYTPDSIEIIDCEETTENCTVTSLPNYHAQFSPFYFKNILYGENYGTGRSRFFGMYSYSEIENRVEITGSNLGENFIIVYEAKGGDYHLVPEYAMNAMIQRILHKYYMASNMGQAQQHNREFIKELSMIRKYENRYSYEDELDAITSQYSNNPK